MEINKRIKEIYIFYVEYGVVFFNEIELFSPGSLAEMSRAINNMTCTNRCNMSFFGRMLKWIEFLSDVEKSLFRAQTVVFNSFFLHESGKNYYEQQKIAQIHFVRFYPVSVTLSELLRAVLKRIFFQIKKKLIKIIIESVMKFT